MTTPGTVRRLTADDLPEFRRMRRALWPSAEESEADELLGRAAGEYVVFVAERDGGGLAGFAEVGTRNYAEGCTSSPVAYLEGIWVDSDRRRDSVGVALVDVALAWAQEYGFQDSASDCALDNDVSYAFHRALGFAEVDRIVCFKRSVTE